jgi:hypothetical protein
MGFEYMTGEYRDGGKLFKKKKLYHSKPMQIVSGLRAGELNNWCKMVLIPVFGVNGSFEENIRFLALCVA